MCDVSGPGDLLDAFSRARVDLSLRKHAAYVASKSIACVLPRNDPLDVMYLMDTSMDLLTRALPGRDAAGRPRRTMEIIPLAGHCAEVQRLRAKCTNSLACSIQPGRVLEIRLLDSFMIVMLVVRETYSPQYYPWEGVARLSCRTCGASGVKLKKCPRCLVTRYCDRECQCIDWKLHRQFCSKIKARANLGVSPPPDV